MPIITLAATAAAQRLATFDAVIDARSPAEYALDHLPGARNWPTLNDAERAHIGTIYKQVDTFEARKQGAVLAARNIAAHLEHQAQHLPKRWKPLIYCWRGGQRSGSLASVLSAIGFEVTLIEGGYKAWRQTVVAELGPLAQRLQYRVICGPTGAGKTRLLHALAAQGAQVLDLEALACHRSSVLGNLPGQDQPSQKRFDGLVWQALRSLDASGCVYVESESKKIGNLRVPDELMQAMRLSPCIDLQLNDDERVALLLEDYQHLAQAPTLFSQRLNTLVPLRGRATVEAWQAALQAGHTIEVVRALLTQHYDPLYHDSIQKNFVHYAQALPCVLAHRGADALEAAARWVLGRG